VPPTSRLLGRVRILAEELSQPNNRVNGEKIMAYQALYRKWRPARFDDFVGQESVIATLRNQVITGRIAHAYLFCGTRGTGKTSAAKVLARAVNCLTPENGEPCGKCTVCKALMEENALDVVEIDAASNNGVDEIRDLREKVKYPPQSGRYRVYIIDEVHMLSSGAFNALLKTLEEPPAHVVFILATTEPQKLPATILSRCQRFDFHRIPAAQIISRLHDAAEAMGVNVEKQAYERIARAAEGGMRDAFSIMDMCLSYAEGELTEALVLQVLGASDRGFLFRFADAMIEGRSGEALAMVDELVRAGREPQVFAKDVSQHLRTMMMAGICGDEAAELLELTQEDAQRYREQGKKCEGQRILRMLDLFLASETDMKWSSQPRIALEVTVVRACMPEEARSVEALLERIETLERRLEQGDFAASARAAAPAKAAAPKTAEGEKKTPGAADSVHAAPAPAPAGDVQNIWADAMRRLRASAPSVHATLMQGRFAGLEDGAYQVFFQQGTGAIFARMFESGDKKAAVEEVLSAASGGAKAVLRVQIEGAVAQSTPRAQADKTLGQIFDAFGRENVEVTDA
jgi:DNA polymerase-3 subunit gamma/tau